MTKKEKKRVPELRFDGFEGEWEKKKYKNIYSFITTNSYSRIQLNYEEGEVKNIHYGDIHTKFPTLFDITKELVPFINSDIDISRYKEENYCKEGDLVIADASEDYADIGKTIEIVNINDEKVLAGLHTFLARPKDDRMSIGFSGYMLQNWSVRKQVMTIAQGTKVRGIASGRLGNIFLTIPDKKEQQKIATFLTSIDTRIQQLEKKKTLLEEYKKGVMQKIFSQEIRFRRDDGEEFGKWEEKRLGDVAIKKSSNIAANKIEDNFGEYIIYGAPGILKRVDFYEEENDYISIVKDGAGVGRVLYCEGKSSVLATLDMIKPKKGLNTYFLYCLLENINFVKYVTGSTIPHIYFKDYKKELIAVPTLPEQTKIAQFLSALDRKIAAMDGQIEKTKEWKKGLLQRMFV